MLNKVNSTSNLTTTVAEILSNSSGETNSMLVALSSLKQISLLIDWWIEQWIGWCSESLPHLRCRVFAVISIIFYLRKCINTVWSCGAINRIGDDTTTNKFSATHGVSLPAPARIFKLRFATNMRRTIDTHPVNDVDTKAYRPHIKSTTALNALSASEAKPAATQSPATTDQPLSKIKFISKTAPATLDQPVFNTELMVVKAHATTDQPVLRTNFAATKAPAMTDQLASNIEPNSK